jgi:hypothetical protein
MRHADLHPPELALRQLCADPAAAFGRALLTRATGAAIPFRDFVAVARDMVSQRPQAAADWLAALVALDMLGQDQDQPNLQPGCN